MARLVFVVGFDRDRVKIDDSFFVIDSSIGRIQDLRKRRSRANEDTIDSLVKAEFVRLIRGVGSRGKAVVLSFPQTAKEAEAVRGILQEAYTVQILVSGRVEEEFKKFLKKNFKHSAVFTGRKRRRVNVPETIHQYSG